MEDWNSLEADLLKDPEFKKGYDILRPYYKLISKLIKSRREKGLTQKQLAERVGTSQSALARFESGNSNPTLAFMQKVAKAVDAELVVEVRQSHPQPI